MLYYIHRLKEDNPIMSFGLSSDGKLAVLNVATQVTENTSFLTSTIIITKAIYHPGLLHYKMQLLTYKNVLQYDTIYIEIIIQYIL